jgi:hypothetical protein
MLSVLVPNVIILSNVLLSNIMLSNIMLSNIMLSNIMPSNFMPSDIMPMSFFDRHNAQYVELSVLMSKAIMLSVIILDAVNSNVVATSEKRRLKKKMEDARFFVTKAKPSIVRPHKRVDYHNR